MRRFGLAAALLLVAGLCLGQVATQNNTPRQYPEAGPGVTRDFIRPAGPATSTTSLRFVVTTPTGAAAGATYALNLYIAPPPAPFQPFVGSNGEGFLADPSGPPDYTAVFSAGAAEIEVPSGDYWYVIFAFNGYSTHGGEASPATVTAVEGQTVETTILQADTEWSSGVKNDYNPICINGLSIDLGFDMTDTTLAADYWSGGALPADGAIKVALATGSNYQDSVTVGCNELGVNAVNLLLWSENHIFGTFCQASLEVQDGFGMCP